MKRNPFLVALSLCLLLAAAASILSLKQPSAQAQPLSMPGSVTFGPDILVNPTSTIETVRQKNFSLAVNPTNPDNVVAAYDSSGTVFLETAYSASTDGGQTWAGAPFTATWGVDNYQSFGDARMVFDAHGTGYLSSYAIAGNLSSYWVLSTTNGLSWSDPHLIAVSDSSEYRSGSTLAVDPRASGANAGNLYMFWLYTNNMKPFWLGIWGRQSGDGGLNWSTDVHISDPEHLYTYGPDSAVASDGTVYVAFEFRPDNNIANDPEIYLTRSTDSGATWSGDRLVSGAPITRIGGPDYKLRELVLAVSSSCFYLRINHFPSIAVSPTDPNTVYVAWNDGRWEQTLDECSTTGKHSDVAFSRTTDGGLTWSAPQRLNDDPQGNGRDQFTPTLTVAADGTIGATWFDRRYDPNGELYDLVFSQSTDGGITWSANQRVSDISSNPDNLQDLKFIDDVGYRKSVVYGPGYVIPTWIDTRLGTRKGDFFVDRGIISGGITPTATPTTIPTGTSTATAQPTVTATTTPGACNTQFTDVPVGSTFYPFVHCLACLNIISGYPCGGPGEPCVQPASDPYFRPNNNVTRGQLAKIVSNSAGFNDPPGAQTFEDVQPGSTFYTFTQRLGIRNVMSGYPCGGPGEPCGSGNLPYFRPNANATRGQISKIVAQAAGLTDPPGAQIFEDVLPGSTFYDYIQRLASRGYMNGYPCGGPGEPCGVGNKPYFRPANNATRGQVSKIVGNAFFPDCNP
ncbi:MAG: S-layer homology domain-containing protein [Chloroflexota bacterium]